MTSPRTAQRLTRILAMLPWVIAHPGATVAEVCRRFDYTPGELAKDLNLVFVCGLPGYGPGDLMDAYIDGDEVVVDTADYFARSVRLTAGEGLMLLSGGMALLASGAAPSALASAVEKLQRALVPDDGSFAVDLPAEPALVDLLRRAATAGEVVEITHTSIAADRTTVRRIEPWRVFATMGNWYVSGHCRMAGGERVFRIDRIRSAEPTGEPFEPPAEPPPPEVRYTPGVEDVEAVIRLEPEAAWVADYYPVEIVEQDERGTTIRFSASDPAVAARLLVRLGSRARVLEGDAVRAATRDLRDRLLRRYETGA